MFQCPNCGGSMVYSISQHKLVCKHCKSKIAPEDYKVNINAEEQQLSAEEADAAGMLGEGKSVDANMNTAAADTEPMPDDAPESASAPARDYIVTVYICRNCGAQLVSPDDSIVSYCVYCGSEQLLKSRMEKSERPRWILPFKLTQRKCRNRYSKALSKLWYLPNEFKDSKYLEKFVGMYIPYWQYNISLKGTLDIELTKRKSLGKKTQVTTYDGTAETGEQPYSISIDASSAFDDTIADHIAPFKFDEAAAFEPGYLAGFYADRPDVRSEMYEEEAVSRADDAVCWQLKTTPGPGGEYATKGNSPEDIKEHLTAHLLSREQFLLPVWFLTWRRKKRVAYSVMNGQTGEMSADLPVDKRKYFGTCLLMAAAFFVIFSIFLTTTAPTALAWTMLTTVIIMCIFGREMRLLRDRENHIFDLAGSRATSASEKKNEKLRKRSLKKRRIYKKNTSMEGYLFAFFLLLVIFFGSLMKVDAKSGGLLIAASCTVIGLISLVRSLLLLGQVQEKLELCVQIPSFLALAWSFWLLVRNTFEDPLLYLACIACLACALLTSAALMHCYDLLVTRPVPSFFTREGGDSDAEDA